MAAEPPNPELRERDPPLPSKNSGRGSFPKTIGFGGVGPPPRSPNPRGRRKGPDPPKSQGFWSGTLRPPQKLESGELPQNHRFWGIGTPPRSPKPLVLGKAPRAPESFPQRNQMFSSLIGKGGQNHVKKSLSNQPGGACLKPSFWGVGHLQDLQNTWFRGVPQETYGARGKSPKPLVLGMLDLFNEDL